MKEAKINCPKCGGHLVYPAELAGQQAPCPHCNESILLPKTKPITAWIIAAVFIFIIVCLASNLVREHLLTKQTVSPPVRVVKNTNSQTVVLQKEIGRAHV